MERRPDEAGRGSGADPDPLTDQAGGPDQGDRAAFIME
jgi:hypothetical protein